MWVSSLKSFNVNPCLVSWLHNYKFIIFLIYFFDFDDKMLVWIAALCTFIPLIKTQVRWFDYIKYAMI